MRSARRGSAATTRFLWRRWPAGSSCSGRRRSTTVRAGYSVSHRCDRKRRDVVSCRCRSSRPEPRVGSTTTLASSCGIVSSILPFPRHLYVPRRNDVGRHAHRAHRRVGNRRARKSIRRRARRQCWLPQLAGRTRRGRAGRRTNRRSRHNTAGRRFQHSAGRRTGCSPPPPPARGGAVAERIQALHHVRGGGAVRFPQSTFGCRLRRLQ